MKFKLHAPYKPTGDQPEAIRQLVEGIDQGYHDQVLLGATGTGKSLGFDEPVFIVEQQADMLIPRLVPLGEFIDPLMSTNLPRDGQVGGTNLPRNGQVGETQILDLSNQPTTYFTRSFDPHTLAADLHPVSAVTRHAAPEEMYRLQTACGRSATMTGHHNLWVLRQGKLQLIETRLAQAGDYLPVPDQLLSEAYNPELDELAHPSDLPAEIPLSLELMRFLGYTIAESSLHSYGLLYKVPDPYLHKDLIACLEQYQIPYEPRSAANIYVTGTDWVLLLGELCGGEEAQRHLPGFWMQLPDEALGELLRAYFDGESHILSSGAVVTTTTSAQLAWDLVYALLRYGIWARFSRRWRPARSSQPGYWYYYISINGPRELRRFAEVIGFNVAAKADKFQKLNQGKRDETSSLDIVPIHGEQLRALRKAIQMTAKALCKNSDLSHSAVYIFENNHSAIRRSTLQRILSALKDRAQQIEGLPSVWWEQWRYLDDLCRWRWTEITTLEPVAYQHPYVYDLTVPGPETFLAGAGGLFVHNTFTIASVIEQKQKPALVMAHNKTLAAQLYAEFKEFFPENAVEYFVSYYDYYQPEAYVPRHDLFIEKDASINEEIERLRLAATTALMSRRDVIIVASVSCIYGIGNPEAYGRVVINLESGNIYRRNALLRQLVEGQYQRNDIELRPGTFRVRGDSLDILPAYQDRLGYRITFFGDEVERIIEFDSITGELSRELSSAHIYPAKHFITEEDKLKLAITDIEGELTERLAVFNKEERLLEAQRIESRTLYDLEMLREVGYCSGIENYSRHLDQRAEGTPPWTLMDYLPSDYLLIIDESHMTVPQVRGMYNGDRSRKQTLVDYGFRLPSALDNRPLTFDEFEQHMGFTIYTSATPGPYEMKINDQVVEQIIRPTALVDPDVEVRPIEGQVDDLIREINCRVELGQRTLVTTLTKRMAEKLSDYLMELGIKVHYLHSEIDTLERIGILRDLRLGVFDVVVGINLLREGLDLPEVSLVAILDADKEGFLRSDTALIQTIGRAARHVEGKVIMYADRITASMERAIGETTRRRAKQVAFNEEHGIQPVGIFKEVRDLTDQLSRKAIAEPQAEYKVKGAAGMQKSEMKRVITELEKQMKEAAKNLEFEKAAVIRDQIYQLRVILADESNAPPWERIRLLSGEE